LLIKLKTLSKADAREQYYALTGDTYAARGTIRINSA
jgi:hypothetical protein